MNGSINLPEEDNKTQLLFPEEDLEEGDQEVRLREAKTKAKAKHKEKKRKSKEEKKKERENKERKRLWDDIFDLDYYSLFKQFGPIIPTLPSIYAIVRSMFVDTSNSSLANWYKVFDFMENLNICLYSIAATVFYKIFEKKKKEEEKLFKKKKKKEAKDQVRMRFAENVRRLNTIFLVFCFLVSGVKLVLGILLAPLDKVPDDQPKGLFYFYLISKLGLIIAQLFYLYTVYVKKYYKARPILDDAADNGRVDGSNGEKKKDDDTDPDKKDDDDDPNKKKDDDPGKKDDKNKEKDKDKKKEKEEKKEDKEKEKKSKENGRSQQDQENFEKVLHTMEENNKFNEKLLSKLEDMDELNQNWSEVKKELSMIKRQNLVLLKFSKPLMEDVELKISNQTDKAENQSFVINAKIYESVKDMKQKIAEKLSLGKTVKVDLKTNQGELKDDGLIGEFDLDHLKDGLLLNYYEGN